MNPGNSQAQRAFLRQLILEEIFQEKSKVAMRRWTERKELACGLLCQLLTAWRAQCPVSRDVLNHGSRLSDILVTGIQQMFIETL